MHRRHVGAIGGGRTIDWTGALLQLLYLAICMAVVAAGLYLLYPDLKPRLTGLSGAQPAARPFADCAAAHAAGYYSIPRGSRAYLERQDLDRDGVACEPAP